MLFLLIFPKYEIPYAKVNLSYDCTHNKTSHHVPSVSCTHLTTTNDSDPWPTVIVVIVYVSCRKGCACPHPAARPAMPGYDPKSMKIF